MRIQRSAIEKSARPLQAFCRLLASWLALLMLIPGLSRAAGQWTLVNTGQELGAERFQVCEFTGTVSITFLGDCTLGGEEKSRSSARGFFRYVEDFGDSYPLSGLKDLTWNDDLTIANLEGVLTDRKLAKREKQYNFSGPTAYTKILQLGGVDCVTLANNHTMDYGEAGYSDTKAALAEADISWFSTDGMAVWKNEEGLRIGFVGIYWNLYEDRNKVYVRQVQYLRDLGCAAVIAYMHAGDEYVYKPSNAQRATALRAVEQDIDLLIGSHPHVVQGMDVLGDVPVVYSLGNCSFGGAAHVKDMDALVVQAVLSFEEGAMTGITLHLYPIAISHDTETNDYAPLILNGEDARRVIEKMEKSTGFELGEYSTKTGAVVEVTHQR